MPGLGRLIRQGRLDPDLGRDDKKAPSAGPKEPMHSEQEVATQAVERPHINKDGLFQSDKYPTCPPGKVPLAVKDKTAQDLLWTYAQRRREVDAEFADDLEFALKQAGYEPTPQIQPQYDLRLSDVVDLRAMEAKFRAGAHHAVTRLAEALEEMTMVKDCRQVADVFADVIGRDRVDDKGFDLNKLIFEAKRQVKGKR